MYARFIKLDWKKLSEAINLSLSQTLEIFSDGRLSGELLQQIAINQFQLIPSSNCDVYDALFPITKEKIEIRLITSYGIKTAPSNQIGANRKFNKEFYLKKLEDIEYFLFLDLRTVTENLPCYLLPSSIVRKFYNKRLLSKVGSTTSNKIISLLLFESLRLPWIQNQGIPLDFL